MVVVGHKLGGLQELGMTKILKIHGGRDWELINND